jgi:curved DNA-binding protein CbpA
MAKHYYSVLGVTPNAEPAVIKAAYKALSNIYHPDKNPDNIEEANRKMAKINEAWEILSNKERKSKYDAEFHNDEYTDDVFEEDNPDVDDALNELFKKETAFAAEFYPDLADTYSYLKEVSHNLYSSYVIYLFTEKAFDRRVTIAQDMEDAFLRIYFGDADSLITFAKALIHNRKNKQALRDLNKAVKILGSKDPETIIETIKSKYFAPAPPPPPRYKEPSPPNDNTLSGCFTIAAMLIIILVVVVAGSG